MATPANWTAWKAALLLTLGAPNTPQNQAFLNAWARREGGHAANNPFNTTLRVPGSTSYNSIGVQNYPTAAIGGAATATTLLRSGRGRYYADIVAALRSGHPSLSGPYQGLHTWSAGPSAAASKGYWGLAGVPTTPPSDAARSAMVDTSSSSSTSSSSGGGCRYHTPFPGMSGDLCLDKVVGALAVAAGGLVLFAGVAVIVAAVLQKTSAGHAATQTAGEVGKVVPLGRAASVARGGATAARTAPPRPARPPARAPAAEDAAVRARVDARRAELARVRSRSSSSPGPNAGRSTAQIKAGNDARHAARTAAAARRPQPEPAF